MSLLSGIFDSPWTAHAELYGEYQYGNRPFVLRKLYLDRYEGASEAQYLLFSPENQLLGNVTEAGLTKKRGQWVIYRYKHNNVYRVVKVDRQVLLNALRRILLPPDHWDKKYPPRS